MANNYLRHVSDTAKLDIMQTVINLYGHKTDILVKMVEDGYPVTLELLELLYRINALDVIKKVIYYDKEFVKDGAYADFRMEVLEKALGKEEALALRKDIVESHQQKLKEKAQQEKSQCEAKVKGLYEKFGLENEFFARIISSEEMMLFALEKYDKDSIIKGIAKTDRRKIFLISEHLSPEDFLRCGLYKETLGVLFIFDTERQKEIIKQMSQTDEGFSVLLQSRQPWVEQEVTCLAKNSPELKEKFKSYGDRGYWFLYNSKTMTEEDFEQWCKIAPKMASLYKEFNKNIFWVIKNGYYKYSRL